MANDLYARLKLDDSEYNRKLFKAIKSTEDFRKKQQEAGDSMKSAMSNVMSLATKAGGAIGLAFGTKAVFDGFINSSQAAGDTFNNSVDAMKDSTNEFFYALSSGDFTSFQNGLTEIFNRAKLAKEALDQLGNTKISYDYVVSDLNQQMADQRVIATDKSATKADRKAALAEMERLGKEKAQYAENLGSQREKSLKSIISAGTALSEDSIDQSLIDKIMKVDISSASVRDAVKQTYQDQYEEYVSAMKDLEKKQRNTRTIGTQAALDNKVKTDAAEKTNLTEQFKEAVVFNQLISKFSDEKLIETITLISEQRALNTELSNEERQRRKIASTIGEKENFKLSESQVLKMEIQSANNIVDQLVDEIISGDPLRRTIILDPVMPSDFEGESWDLSGVQSYEPKEVFNNQSLQDNISSLTAISGLLQGVTGLVNSDSNAWGNWGLTTLATISSTVSQLMGLYAAQMAAGIASQSKLIFPYNVAAMSATAGAMISIIGSLPKFETGGVVGGSSYYGDKILARVNSSELILNQDQQKKANALMSQSSGGATSGNVEFKVRGADLIGVLRNYESKRRI